MRAAWILVLSLWSLCLPGPSLAAAPSIGMFTIVDGDAVVIRGSQKFAAAEGLPVLADDIVHTGDATRITRVELAAGGALDLGPQTRLWLRPRFAEPRTTQPAQAYLAGGWIKLSSSGTQKLGLASSRADLSDLAGVAVARVTPNASFLFIEAGAATVTDRLAGPRSRRLKEGEAFDRRDGDVGAGIARPAPDMIEAMPRSFADSLPLRAKRFEGEKVEPESPADIAYADVAGWINAERSVRPAFLQRWAALANDARFRTPLVAELRAHPEWARVLFPEKVARKRATPAVQVAARPVNAPATAPLPARFALPESTPSRSLRPEADGVRTGQVRADADRDPLRPWEARKP